MLSIDVKKILEKDLLKEAIKLIADEMDKFEGLDLRPIKDLETVKREIEGLDSSIDTNETNISDLERRVSKLEDKK